MQLPADLFEEIAGCTVTASGTDAKDRRRSHRFSLSASSLLVRFRQDQPPLIAQVQIRELSSNGIAVIHAERLWLDEEFLVRLPTSAGKGVWVQCRTTRWQPLASQSHMIGADFVAFVEASDIVDPIEPTHDSATLVEMVA